MNQYLALVNKYAPRPIKTEEQLEEALSAIKELALKPEEELTEDEADYLEVLAILVEDYEDENYPEFVGNA